MVELFSMSEFQKQVYINELLTKKSLRDIIGDILKVAGTAKTANFLDEIKTLGYNMSFKGGLSFNLGGRNCST